MQFTEHVAWIAAPPIYYSLGLDGISLPLVLMTVGIMPLCVLASWNAITTNIRGFMAVLLVMETAMVGVFVALDFVLFYVFWEAMLIPMYLLIGVWGGPNRLYAAIKFFLYTLAGSVLLLVAILVLYFYGGHTFDILALSQGTYPASLQIWLFLAFFAAFAVKVPMFPFHTWLPDAHVEAPTAGSVILASILLKMGTYGFLRFSLPMLPDASRDLYADDGRPLHHRDHLRGLYGTGPSRSQETDRLFEREPHGVRHPWPVCLEPTGHRRSRPPNGQPWDYDRRDCSSASA